MASAMDRSGRRQPYDDRPVKARIVTAAAKCFERFGMRRATIDDVANAAGVSRQTVYNHFADKAELIGEFMSREARRVNGQARARFDLELPSPELLVEAELALLDAARRNEYAEVFLAPDAVDITEQVVDRSARVAEAQHEFWDPVLDVLETRGDLRDGLDRNELVDWLTFTHLMLCIRTSTFGGSTEETGAYLREFLAPPILK